MKLIEMKCPGCGAALQAEEGRKTIYCQYCGTPVQVDDESLRIHVTNTYVNEAAVRSVDLERQKFETETRQRENEQAELNQKKAEWTRYMIMYLGALGIAFFLYTLLAGVRFIGPVLEALTGVIMVFGGIGLYVLRPVKNTAARNSNTIRVVFSAGSDKSRMTAFILCLLFGVFGVHQFYAGNKGKGILYLFTVGLFGIGWLIDLFLILTGQFKDSYGRAICR